MPVERFIPFVIILGVAVLLVLIGVMLGLRQRTKGAAANETNTSDKLAPEQMKGKALTRSPSTNLPADAILVLRDPISSEWVVEVNGIRYANLKDIHDDRAASKVLDALSGLQRFAGSIPIIKPELKVSSGVVPPRSAASARDIEPSVAQALKKGGAAASTALYPAPPNSILDQIEKILQHNLLRYPEFAERKIHVGASADGSLLIEVDRQFYQHADEVPDLAIRGVIKAAIQEWERAV